MKTEAEPFYIRGENYGDTVCEAKSSDPVTIPSLELSRPSGDELILLSYLYEKGETSINKLSDELEEKLEKHSNKAINRTLSKRADEDYVKIIPHKGARLTPKGKKLMNTLEMMGELEE